jgi:glycosyltransferase involved in cell wall biosynthesis
VIDHGGDAPAAIAEALAHGPDLVHLATPGPLGPHVTEILRQTHLVVDVHGHWPLCPHGDLMRRPQFLRCDVRYPADACAACAGFERLREMDSRVRLLGRADAVVAHAPFQADRLTALLERPVEYVDYGVDVERFKSDPEPPKGEATRALFETRGQGKRVLLLGPPQHARGIDRLVDLVVGVRARVPNATFVVAGSDPDNPGWSGVFHTELAELGLGDAVIMIDRLPPDDLPALLVSCDVGVSPAMWDDPGGMFVLQALAAGLPTVTSGRGALAELAEHGSGMLASPDAPAMFADRVAMLLQHPAVRASMGSAARLHAVEHHDDERGMEAMSAIHRRIAGEADLRAA